MLKIKDDVDLEILENFGFKYDDIRGKYLIEEAEFHHLNHSITLSFVSVNIWNRIVEYDIPNSYSDDKKFEKALLIDLIAGGLVEEINDNKQKERGEII